MSPRPLDQQGKRVLMYLMDDHRASHKFMYPRCFCPDGGLDTLEADICLASPGEYHNYWVAVCAKDVCGYFGKNFTIRSRKR